MADISKIKVGEPTYNIKDSQARSDLATQSSQIANLESGKANIPVVTNLTPLTTTIPSGVVTDLIRQNLSPGIYGMYVTHQWEGSADNIFTYLTSAVGSQQLGMIRNNNGMYAGGGVALSAFFKIDVQTPFAIGCYQSSGSSKKISNVGISLIKFA